MSEKRIGHLAVVEPDEHGRLMSCETCSGSGVLLEVFQPGATGWRRCPDCGEEDASGESSGGPVQLSLEEVR